MSATFTVIGGSGYVGQHVCAALRATGHSVWVPHRADTSWLHGQHGSVVFAAGLTADFRRRPLATVEAHVGLLAKMLRKTPFERMVYLSSTRVYSGQGSTDEDAPLLVRPTDGSDLYNLSKLMGESLCMAHPERHISVLRLSNVVGGLPVQADSFLGMLWEEAKHGHIQLQAHPDSAKDYIHISDVVNAVLAALSRGAPRIYNVASGFNLSHRDWATALADAAGATWSGDKSAAKWLFPVISNTRLRTELGVLPRHTPESLLHSVADELPLSSASAQ